VIGYLVVLLCHVSSSDYAHREHDVVRSPAAADFFSTGLDTACQPKHYREDLVGEGLRRAIRDKVVKREDVFVQTKFTSIDGQDPKNMPYHPKDSLVEQVKRSIEKSLQNFDVSNGSIEASDRSTYLNSVVLHSPLRSFEETMEVWQALESYVPSKILNLGISNVSMLTLPELYERAVIKPSVVQNRFYPATKFDVDVRRFCRDKGIIYQSFWTISANPQLLRSAPVGSLSKKLGISREASLYCLVLSLDHTVVLNGTTKKDHMLSDWQALSLAKGFAVSNPSEWEDKVRDFKVLIGQV
jgi:diketogulonate reductase-like aldo/keto reductase